MGLRKALVAERRDWFVKVRAWWRVGKGETRRGICEGLEELRRLVARRREGMVVSMDAMIAGYEPPPTPQCGRSSRVGGW